ncbi:MAG: right-handed parallel beta-helix repeat-containing protein [Polyangiales bacterium]
MQKLLLTALVCVATVACGGEDPVTDTTGGDAAADTDVVATDTGTSGSDTGTSASDTGGTKDAAPPPPPKTVCDLPAKPVDTSKPTTVVGDGTAASCTEAAFRAAVAKGGIVTFACGDAPVKIVVGSEVPVAKGTTIDGGKKVTLSGGGTSRILHITSAWDVATPLLTVQNLVFVDGFTSDVPNTKSTLKGGGAIFQDGGSLTVIDCTFTHNQCATSGQDVSGGAINGQGVGTLIVVGSTFSDNTGSNGGAVGTQAENVTVVNSTFSGNSATGTDGNPGNGGNGGGLTYDGAHVSLTLCGDTFTGNKANAAGGAVFRVGYDSAGGVPSVVTIDR